MIHVAETYRTLVLVEGLGLKIDGVVVNCLYVLSVVYSRDPHLIELSNNFE